MTNPVLYADLRLAKQRRAHAIVMNPSTDYRYYTDLVEALDFALDAGYREITIETDFGRAEISVHSLALNKTGS